MRIVVTGQIHQHDPQSFIRNLSQANEVDLYVVTDSTNYPELPFLNQEKIYHYKPTWPEPISRLYPHDQSEYDDMVQDIEPDIMLSFGVSDLLFMSSTVNFSPAVLIAQGGEKSKASVTPYWTNNLYRKIYYRLIFRPVFRDLLTHVDEVWASEPTRDAFHKLGLPRKNFRSFDWGSVDTETFTPRDEGVEYVNDEQTTVIGSFRRVRGDRLLPSYRTFFDAINDLQSRREDFHVVIGGLYPDNQSTVIEELIDEKIQEYGLQKFVTQLEMVPKAKLPQYYSGLDVYVNFTHKGLSVGVGTASKEAMACTCPIISFDDPSPSYLIDDGKNGFVVPHGESGTLSERLNMLCSDHERREEMGVAARRTIEARFSEKQIRTRVIEISSRILREY